MKKLFLLCALISTVFACKNEEKLSFDELKKTSKICDNCPVINVVVPVIVDTEEAFLKNINAHIEKVTASIFTFDENIKITTINQALVFFNDEAKKMQEEFPDEATDQWEVDIDGSVNYESKNILTIKLESYIFTGGAHGYSATTFLNYDKRTGEHVENWELFKDLEEFTAFAERKFRIQESIPQEENINTTGFMFETDAFELPKNMGYTKEGIVLIYNQYEITSYADGQKTLILPYNELKTFGLLQ